MPIDPITGKAIIDPAFKRSPQAEAAAIASGMTKAEIEARGGVSAAGYYGDSWSSKTNLTDIEYADALKQGGGSAINAATAAKAAKNNPPAPQGGSGSGSNDTPIVTGKVLAEDTFKSTLALLWGTKEANEPYVGKLYQLVSGFYKTGSTMDESINLAIRKARDENVIPEFTKRFAGIFALEDKRRAGQAVEVPTVTEFFAAEAKMGELLQSAGLGSLATQEFLGDIIGKGKSVLDVGNLVSDVFNTIDYAPEALKTTLQTYFPGVDRASIAKAILTGEKGATELSNQIKGISVLSAAATQGVKGVGLPYAQNLANMGLTYKEAISGFGTVKNLERAGEVAAFGGTTFTTEQAQKAVFEKSVKELNILEELRAQEEGRFKGSSGVGKTSLTTDKGQF